MRIPSVTFVVAFLCLSGAVTPARPSSQLDRAGSSPDGAVRLQGAGATYPQPLYAAYLASYARQNPTVTIDYQAIGSGGGILQVTERTVDFGATDLPMTDEQLEAVHGEVLHIPIAVSGAGVVYNVPDLDRPFRLDGPTIANVFLGKISKWNDRRIAELNPGVTLPNVDIAVAYRADGNFTTAVFSQYLARMSSRFATKIGAGVSLKWPVGAGRKGNEGVAGFVANTPGAIGYVDSVYARRNDLVCATIRDASGEFVEPSLDALAAAARTAELPDDLRGSIVNADGPGAYPIAALSYLLIPTRLGSHAKARALVEFVVWALHDDEIARELGYAHVPSELAGRAEALLKRVDAEDAEGAATTVRSP